MQNYIFNNSNPPRQKISYESQALLKPVINWDVLIGLILDFNNYGQIIFEKSFDLDCFILVILVRLAGDGVT